MGRPRVTEERREQILEAFERCVAEFGLVATTLDRVAELAGVRRAMIRHHVGNRDELIRAAVERMTANYRRAFEAALEGLGPGPVLPALLDHLLLGGFTTDSPSEDRAVDALITASASDERVRRHLREMYGFLEDGLAAQLREAYPDARVADARGIAYAIMALAESNHLFQALGFPADRARRARRSAQDLLDTLA